MKHDEMQACKKSCYENAPIDNNFLKFCKKIEI